ncbi:MAG: hypothetical protein RR506_07040 [Akkermansia sp.]
MEKKTAVNLLAEKDGGENGSGGNLMHRLRLTQHVLLQTRLMWGGEFVGEI